MTVVMSTGSRFLCYKPLIEMITVQSLWHIIIWDRSMSQGLNQYPVVTKVQSVREFRNYAHINKMCKSIGIKPKFLVKQSIHINLFILIICMNYLKKEFVSNENLLFLYLTHQHLKSYTGNIVCWSHPSKRGLKYDYLHTKRGNRCLKQGEAMGNPRFVC